MCIINILAKLIHQADGDVITDIVHNTVDLVVCLKFLSLIFVPLQCRTS